MKPIAIYGVGGLGREILAVIKRINAVSPTWQMVGWFDDNTTATEVNGYKVLGNQADIASVKEPLALILAFGNHTFRRKVKTQITNHYISFPTIIDPSCTILDPAHVHIAQEGVILGAETLLTTNIKIAEFTLIHHKATLCHDTHVGAYCSVMANVTISSGAVITDDVMLPAGTVVNRYQVISNV